MIYAIQLISMALFAKDNDETISAWDALPGKLYECLECQTPLRLRRSYLKFPHFYHLSTPFFCRLYSKSEKHLLIQYEIRKEIPQVFIEKAFPTIQRIADVVWEEKKIIFEIQCSFITEEEAKSRVKEYGSLGYVVVWILDDQRFNRKAVSAAEVWMRTQSSYFIDKHFVFYDQLETIQDQKRIQRGGKMPIELSPLPIPAHAPKQLQNRIHNKYYFKNDVLDLALQSQITFLPKPKVRIKEFFNRYFKRPYSSFLDYLLKIDCGR